MEEYNSLKIIIVCALSFGPALFFVTHDFVFDDAAAVTRNDDVFNKNRTIYESLCKILVHDFWGQNLHDERSHKSYRPVVTMIFNLEFRFFNPENLATVMKRVNLLVHICNCCIIYEVFKKMFPNPAHQSIVLNSVILFAAHPIHTEVICSVVGRADLVCAFLFFTVIFLYLDLTDEHVQNGGLTSTIDYWKGAIAFDFAIMSAFSKEIGVMVLPFCIVYDLLTYIRLPIYRRRDAGRRFIYFWRIIAPSVWRCLLLSIMTMSVLVLRFFWMIFGLPQFKSFENPIAAHPNYFTRLASSLYVHALSMWLMICPEWLCCDWSHGSLDLVESWIDYRNIGTTILYLFLINCLYFGPRNVRIALALLIIPFLPSSHLLATVGFVIADRVLYIPSLGFCLLVAIGMHYIHAHLPKIITTAFWTVIVIFMIRCNMRSLDWRSNSHLFKSALHIVPNNAKMYFNLGQIAALENNYNLSLEHNLIANKLKPGSISTLINLGNAYRNTDRVAEALKYHREVVKSDPDYPLGWMNLAITYVANNQLEEALSCYLEADKLMPDNGKITFNLGNLYLRLGFTQLAEKMFRKSITLNPTSHKSHINLIVYLSEHGTQTDLMEAIDNANLTMTDNIPILIAIAGVLSRINADADRIEKILKRVIELDAKNLMALGQLAIHYHKWNKPELAVKFYKTAQQINPTFRVKDERFVEFIKMWNISEQLKKEAAGLKQRINKLLPDNHTRKAKY